MGSKQPPDFSANAEFVEELYDKYLADPESVGPGWRSYFEALQAGAGGSAAAEVSAEEIRQRFKALARSPLRPVAQVRGRNEIEAARKQAAVLRLIQAYRLYGHLNARVDPIDLRAQPSVPDLDPHYHGLSDADLDLTFNTGNLYGKPEMTLREILEVLRETYTEAIGAEYLHIYDVEEKRWLQQRLESTRTNPHFTADQKRQMLERLTAAEGIEQYLHTRYAGQKRFSLEGGETLITALDTLIAHAGGQQVEELVIGMAHRGRLNVLVNIMGKSPRELFEEFEGRKKFQLDVTGDVKYHQGYSSDARTPGGIVHLTLGFNPSHLEIVDPVTEGSTRSRQDRRGDVERRKVMAVLVHGDAAFAGQGVIYETFNLSQTRGYRTGGTIHLVVNNRIGFTTSHPLDTRSMLYCTDVGKVVQTPIFHVNGDDPEAVAFVAQMAVDYRMAFKRDVIIDLVCYRRHGHNEADEPAATQPMMYRKIRARPTPREVYAQRLQEEGVEPAAGAEARVKAYRQRLEQGEQVVPAIVTGIKDPWRINFNSYRRAKWTDDPATGLPAADIRRLGALLSRLPEDFELHPRVVKVMDDRVKMASGALPLDWGFAEIMAYASLLEQGFRVRLSGQDSGRGTFFHRHAVVHNMRTGDAYVPLRQLLGEKEAPFTIIDSILSEEAVLGFEYGYSAADPGALVIWEAQFGDFVNGAQVVIDQFISAAEQKWGLLVGLTLMLPHGWEGQGPEHTSARLERFLQLSAQENMQVCYPSTPAQMFHLLRRQMIRPYRKPLVIMTPKSLLRFKGSFSALDEIAAGSFRNVIGETQPLTAADVRRVVACSGKVYYDLLEARRERKIGNIALLRLEQLYPFPAEQLARELAAYPNATEVYWCQEEPQNQGAWYSIQDVLRTCLRPEQKLFYAGRAPMAAPAGGDHQKHLERQQKLVGDALTFTKAAAAAAAQATATPQLLALRG